MQKNETNTVALSSREILKKINVLDKRIQKYERELIQIEFQWKKKKDSVESVKKDFGNYLHLMYKTPDKEIKKES